MNELEQMIKDIVDLVMPELTPHESSMYIFLFRNTIIEGIDQIRIGQRSIADKYGKGPKESTPSRAHIKRQLGILEEKGCIAVGDTNIDGTLYTVHKPREIPFVAEKLEVDADPEVEEDYFHNPEKRNQLFERDNWTCFFCGEKVNAKNATLDHYIPQHMGGNHSKENLKTACLICNSIKSGKTYEEAAPLLLKSISDRARKSQ